MNRRDWLTIALAVAVVFWLAGHWPQPEQYFALVPAPNGCLHLPGYPDPIPIDTRPSRKSVESIFRLMEDYQRRFSP